MTATETLYSHSLTSRTWATIGLALSSEATRYHSLAIDGILVKDYSLDNLKEIKIAMTELGWHTNTIDSLIEEVSAL